MNGSWSNHSDEFTYYGLRFWPLIILNVFSIFCSLFLLTLLLSDRNLRTALHNHLVIILLLVNLVSQFIDNPLYLNYLRLGYVWPPTPATCIVWLLTAYQFYVTSTLIVALASVQRHILIFSHRQYFSTSRRRFLFHYLPIVLLLIYAMAYGLVLIKLLITDGYPYDFYARMCGGLQEWILQYPSLSIYDMIVNGLLPTPVIAVASVVLLLRVLKQKKRMLRRIEWQKQRKLAVQLLSIASLFCIINLPPILMYVLERLIGRKYLVGMDMVLLSFRYMTYYQSVFLPFICWISLWKSSKKWMSKLIRTHTDFSLGNRIAPVH